MAGRENIRNISVTANELLNYKKQEETEKNRKKREKETEKIQEDIKKSLLIELYQLILFYIEEKNYKKIDFLTCEAKKEIVTEVLQLSDPKNNISIYYDFLDYNYITQLLRAFKLHDLKEKEKEKAEKEEEKRKKEIEKIRKQEEAEKTKKEKEEEEKNLKKWKTIEKIIDTLAIIFLTILLSPFFIIVAACKDIK